jgi:SET domain-containing protein
MPRSKNEYSVYIGMIESGARVWLLSDGTLMDGARGGNATRHINHSCAPNVEAIEVRTRQSRLGVQIFAKRTVHAGEELLLDYPLDVVGEDPLRYPCMCGARTCRGPLAATNGAESWNG